MGTVPVSFRLSLPTKLLVQVIQIEAEPAAKFVKWDLPSVYEILQCTVADAQVG